MYLGLDSNIGGIILASDFDGYFFQLFHSLPLFVDSAIDSKIVIPLRKSAGLRNFLPLLSVDVEALIGSANKLILIHSRVIRNDDLRVDASLFIGLYDITIVHVHNLFKSIN